MLTFVSLWTAAQGVTDNEILITQTGDNLTLTIDQQGYGNKISGDTQSGSDLTLTGSTMELNIDQIGNSNKFFGSITSDNSTYNLVFTGDSNVWDWQDGGTGSTDSTTVDVDVTGSTNTFDVDHGEVASSERLDLDLTLIGWDYTGSDGDIVTSQTDGAYHEINMTFDGDSADIDIIQSSGTCATGITSCYSITTMDVTSDNATITINQTD
jgi:hypothetical protein